MSRVPPTPVEVWVDDRWHRGILRTCEVTRDGTTCSGVVSWRGVDGPKTGRFSAARMRHPSGEPGCPVAHGDESCGIRTQS
jgi:hypothetical protein